MRIVSIVLTYCCISALCSDADCVNSTNPLLHIVATASLVYVKQGLCIGPASVRPYVCPVRPLLLWARRQTEDADGLLHGWRSAAAVAGSVSL